MTKTLEGVVLSDRFMFGSLTLFSIANNRVPIAYQFRENIVHTLVTFPVPFTDGHINLL